LWLERGRDQRLAGRSGFEHEADHYRVQNFTGVVHLLGLVHLRACAEFILRHVGFIQQAMTRYAGWRRAKDWRIFGLPRRNMVVATT
jgi:hypothetical protein